MTQRQVVTPDVASDVDYTLSFDTIQGTGTRAAMTDGRPIIGKTGTTETAQSAFFLGAIPQYSLAIGMFTNQQNAKAGGQSLNGVGGLPGYGGNWPAMIWHAFAQKEFAKLAVQNFPAPSLGGTAWNLVGQAQLRRRPARSRTPPSPTRPRRRSQPTPTCTGVPVGPPCGHHSPPPTTPPATPTSPNPSPSCTPGQKHCHTLPPGPG